MAGLRALACLRSLRFRLPFALPTCRSKVAIKVGRGHSSATAQGCCLPAGTAFAQWVMRNSLHLLSLTIAITPFAYFKFSKVWNGSVNLVIVLNINDTQQFLESG